MGKNIKDNVICLNKQQIKDAVAYLLFNFCLTDGFKIFCQIIGIPMGSDPAPFFANLDLIKARKLCNIFRFINDLNPINDDGKFESSYSNIYLEELQLGKENTDKHEASFLDLDIKISTNFFSTISSKFHFSLFDKRDLFPFSIVRMPDKSRNVPSSIVYSAIGAESLRTARASNNLESFSTAIKPLTARMSN